MSILTPTFNLLDFIPLCQLRWHLSMFKLYTEWTWARMPRPDVCKIADGEEKTSPLLYPDKITHFLLFLLEKVSQATALVDRFPTVRLVIGDYRWLGALRAKLPLKASRVCVALSHAIGLEECEIISSFTRQSRTLVSTLFISLLLSHVTGNTFISSLTKCDFYHVLFLSATAFKSHTWSFKNFRTK